MISMIPMQYKIIAAVAIVCVLCGGAYIKGREVGLSKLHEFQLEVEKANATVAESNRIKIELAEQNTREVALAYVRHSDDIERSYVSRLAGLRREASNCATSTLVAASTGRPDETPAQSGASTQSFEATCFEIERNAAGDALQLMWLQYWVQGTCK